MILSGGGSDVAPRRYGHERHPQTAAEEPGRDDFELALARAAREQDIPLLGICRGMQLLNVAYGGTLHQHLPDVLGHDEHRELPAAFARHEVRIEPGSLAATATENAHRGRALAPPPGAGRDRRGPATSAAARASTTAPRRSRIRAARFLLGVLWHPEEDERSRVVGALVAAARERHRSREA